MENYIYNIIYYIASCSFESHNYIVLCMHAYIAIARFNNYEYYYSTCMQVPRFFSLEKISGLEWESNPHSHISGVMLYQLSYQAPWEQGGGKEGIQVLVLGAHYIRRSFSYETPLR